MHTSNKQKNNEKTAQEIYIQIYTTRCVTVAINILSFIFFYQKNKKRLKRFMVDGVNQQYFSYIVAISFIGERIQSTLKKSPTCRKSLTNFIT